MAYLCSLPRREESQTSGKIVTPLTAKGLKLGAAGLRELGLQAQVPDERELHLIWQRQELERKPSLVSAHCEGRSITLG